MESNEIEWDRMRSNEIEWEWMRSNEIEWGRMRSNMGRHQVDILEPPNPAAVARIQLWCCRCLFWALRALEMVPSVRERCCFLSTPMFGDCWDRYFYRFWIDLGRHFVVFFLVFGPISAHFLAASPFSPFPKPSNHPISIRRFPPGVRRSAPCAHNAFWATLLALIFHFFQKGRKCEISEEYNTKRGSEPSKSINFCIGFSLFFPTPFWRSFFDDPAPI